MLLPSIAVGEEIHLRFWQWFSYSTYDAGYVQISVWNPGTSTWSAWSNISEGVNNSSSIWSLADVDLTRYAGNAVRLAFYHAADRNVYGDSSESTGWYIDDIEINLTLPKFSGDFECGWISWGVSNGVWQIGSPTAGAPYAYSGSYCAGTVLNGNYPAYTSSRLISSTFTVPEDGNMQMTFYHWYSYSSYDSGYVQISLLDESSGLWSSWANIAGPYQGVSGLWTLAPSIDLSSYAGRYARIAFLHTANRNVYGDASESTGWYIDHVRITGYKGLCE